MQQRFRLLSNFNFVCGEEVVNKKPLSSSFILIAAFNFFQGVVHKWRYGHMEEVQLICDDTIWGALILKSVTVRQKLFKFAWRHLLTTPRYIRKFKVRWNRECLKLNELQTRRWVKHVGSKLKALFFANFSKKRKLQTYSLFRPSEVSETWYSPANHHSHDSATFKISQRKKFQTFFGV